MKKHLIENIRLGNVVIMPTDTVYGICCRFNNAKAVHRMSNIKGRKSSSGFVLLVSDAPMLKDYILETEPPQLPFRDNIPTTFIYKNHQEIISECLHKDGSVAVRISQNSFISNLIKKIGVPLATTSANLHAQKTPSIFEEIDPELKQKVDFCFPYNEAIETSMTHQPSRIVEVVNGNTKIIRNA